MKRTFKYSLFILAFAVYWESISLEFWVYDEQISRLSLFGVIPVLMIPFWIAVFTISLALSQGLYKTVSKSHSIPMFDKTLYVFDILSFGFIGSVFEMILNICGLLHYSPDLQWTIIPLIHLPINTIAGYFGIGMFVPSTLRMYSNR